MTAAHFFAPSVEGDVVRLEGEEGRHAVRALRIRPGEPVTISDGRGTVVDARAARAEGDALVCEVVERRTVEPAPPALHLFPAVPKSSKLDLVVQKATEIGVAAISPWFAERSVARWDARKCMVQGERLRAVAHAAAKQSRRAWLPDVADPGPLGNLPATTFVLHESAHAPLGAALHAGPPAELGLVVGPEGGLDAIEVERLVAAGAIVAGLGAQILRAETAAIVAPALFLFRYGILG